MLTFIGGADLYGAVFAIFLAITLAQQGRAGCAGRFGVIIITRMPSHWLIKSEPYKYPYSQLKIDGVAVWDGVRNFEARNNLRAMKKGDLVLYYHSNEGKEIVGVARVKREAYQDPTTKEDWSAVDFEPVAPLGRPVGLAAIKAEPALAEMQLLRRGRLSVVPVTAGEFRKILTMGKTKLPSAQRSVVAKRPGSSASGAGQPG
jgi:predicted RNA-binding protein with PUA-like domain